MVEHQIKKTIRTHSTFIGLSIASMVVMVVFVLALSGVAANGTGETAVTNWTTIINETYETGIAGTAEDLDGATNGEYYWATTAYTASSGSQSIWATGGGTDGSSLSAGTDNYPSNAESALTYGPVNLSSYTAARLSYDYWTQTEAATDRLQVRASTDGTTFNVLTSYDGDSAGWQSESVSLDSYAGSAQVWVRFYFTSNSNTEDVGVFIDNMLLEASDSELVYLPLVRKDATPTPSPTPTAQPAPPPGEFSDNFNDNSNNWLIRRHDTDVDGEEYTVDFEDGLMKVYVGQAEDYVLISPLAQAPDGDFVMEFSAKFISQLNKHRYGFVFGGDWDGGTCPNTNFTSCFNTYYWLEIQYRDNNSNPKLQYRLYRIDNHDSNNQPIRVGMSDWSDVLVSYDITDFVKWKLTVKESGEVRLSVNDVPEDIMFLQDTRYLDDGYVGLMVRTRSSGINEVHFDYFTLEEKE